MEESNFVIKIPNGSGDREEKGRTSTGIDLPQMVKLLKNPGAKSVASGKVSPGNNDNLASQGAENNESKK